MEKLKKNGDLVLQAQCLLREDADLSELSCSGPDVLFDLPLCTISNDVMEQKLDAATIIGSVGISCPQMDSEGNVCRKEIEIIWRDLKDM